MVEELDVARDVDHRVSRHGYGDEQRGRGLGHVVRAPVLRCHPRRQHRRWRDAGSAELRGEILIPVQRIRVAYGRHELPDHRLVDGELREADLTWSTDVREPFLVRADVKSVVARGLVLAHRGNGRASVAVAPSQSSSTSARCSSSLGLACTMRPGVRLNFGTTPASATSPSSPSPTRTMDERT